MESDLFYGIKEDLLNDLHKKYIIYQLAKSLKFVHSAGLVHRDVKPSNILINPNCEIRLCDFGLSRTLWKYNNQETKLTEFIATRWYRSPEVLFGSHYYNTKSDMWSVGCLIYEMYARRPLLPGNDTVEQIQKVL
jgi:mitogen-activated protein kinase 15